MKAFIFMNHHIKEPKSKEPFITVQTEGISLDARSVRITGPSTIYSQRTPTKKIKTHSVRAWVECEFHDIRVKL